MKVVDELGYSLPRRRSRQTLSETKTIAVVHFAGPGAEAESALPQLAAAYVSGIQGFCQGKDVNWALIANYQESNVNHIGHEFLEGDRLSFDGVIAIMPLSSDSTVLRRAMDEHIPVVVVSRSWPDLPVSTVGQDHPQQARLALDHLTKLGHRKIAFLARTIDRPYDWYATRLAYYRDTMSAMGEYDPQRIVIAPDLDRAVGSLLDRCPEITAIFAVNDACAVQVMCGIYQVGLRVPEHVSVIGVGDDSFPSLKGYPGLTTIGFPARKVGILAAKVLLEHIEDPELAYSRVFVQSWVVERDSCAGPREEGVQ